MASIRKLEGRAKPWQVRVRREGKSFAEYFRTKKEADKFAATVEADFDRWGRTLGGELRRHTLADLIDRYMRQWRGRDHNMGARLAWWREQYGTLTLAQFGPDTAREGVAKLETEPAPHGGHHVTTGAGPRSGATVNRYKAALSSAFRAAIDGGWYGVTENPAAGIRKRKEATGAMGRFGRCLEDDERARLLAACDRDPWPGLGVFVRLALATGARRGELLGLEWRDVDLKAGSVLFRATKNDEDRRVPLIPEARARLEDWGRVRRLDDPRVFPGSRPDRAPLLDKAWTRAKAAAGVENLRIHDLRHSAGSYLARAGASAFQIAGVLGHRSGPGLTARYVHLVAEESRGLLEGALSGVLGGEG